MIKKFLFFLPSVIIMSVIFYLSSLSSTGIDGSLTRQFIIHKSLHILVYSSLSASFYIAFYKTSDQKNSSIILTKSILLTYIYGLSDELHQSFVEGRGGKISDTLFDLIGALIGAIAARSILKRM